MFLCNARPISHAPATAALMRRPDVLAPLHHNDILENRYLAFWPLVRRHWPMSDSVAPPPGS
jgi:hypothetical protein